MKTVTAIALGIAASTLTLSAVDPAIGTWKKSDASSATSSAPDLILVIEAAAGNGRHIMWKAKGPDGKMTVVMTLDSALDGSDAPVLGADGKPSGQTMGIKRIDERHAITALKLHGKQYATTKSEISADGKIMTAITEMPQGAPGVPGRASTTTEIWEKQ